MHTRTLVIVLGLSVSALMGCATSGVRRIDSGSGYELSAVSVAPRPGTTLVAGQPVTFKITVKYHLEAADTGHVILIPQDERGTSLVLGREQASQVVRKGSGQVTISDSVTVPPGIRQVQLFVLLVPKGYTRASGQLFMNFPVRAAN